MLARHWKRLGSELDLDDFTDSQAAAAIARLTGGNFRLLQRLVAQMDRVLRINELTTITEDVVEAAADERQPSWRRTRRLTLYTPQAHSLSATPHNDQETPPLTGQTHTPDFNGLTGTKTHDKTKKVLGGFCP